MSGHPETFVLTELTKNQWKMGRFCNFASNSCYSCCHYTTVRSGKLAH